MKIKIFALLLFAFILGGCGVRKSVIPDDTLYNENSNKSNKDTTILENYPNESVPEVINSTLLSDNSRNTLSATIGVSPEKLVDEKLYSFVDYWLDVPYLWGGESHKGVDCSSLVQQLYQEVYSTIIPRTSGEQFLYKDVKQFRKKKYLKEGDLIFFRINRDKTISHVGVYLQNNKFVASGSSGGVQIEDINDPYWVKTFAACGRVVTIDKN